MTDNEPMEVKIARIDENVKSIRAEIKNMRCNCNRDMADHEDRIRNNERFKQRGYGALGILAVAVSVIVIIVGWIAID